MSKPLKRFNETKPREKKHFINNDDRLLVPGLLKKKQQQMKRIQPTHGKTLY